MFKDGKKSFPRKESYKTMNDQFFNDQNLAGREMRRQHLDEMRAEAKANDEQVRHTNVRIGGYGGWKPIPPGGKSKPNIPKVKSMVASNSYTPMGLNKVKDAPGLIWSEQEMFKTTK
jgi:hypothetical protein